MSTLLREHELPAQFRILKRASTNIIIAVPFWGKGAISALGLNRLSKTQKVQLICNLRSGACNPYVIEEIKKIPNVKIRTNARLHAKIYGSERFIIIGSSNASTNGLTIEGDDLTGWIEANVLSHENGLIQNSLKLFRKILDSKETKIITKKDLKEAKELWDNRPVKRSLVKAGTLLAACRENPKLFETVYICAYEEDLGPGGTEILKDIQKDAKDLSFKRANGYQFEDELKKGMWLLDLDCRNKANPKFHGCAQVSGLVLKVKNEHDLVIANRGVVKVPGSEKFFRLSSNEKDEIIRNAKRLLQLNSGIIPLSKAIQIMEKHS